METIHLDEKYWDRVEEIDKELVNLKVQLPKLASSGMDGIRKPVFLGSVNML